MQAKKTHTESTSGCVQVNDRTYSQSHSLLAISRKQCLSSCTRRFLLAWKLSFRPRRLPYDYRIPHTGHCAVLRKRVEDYCASVVHSAGEGHAHPGGWNNGLPGPFLDSVTNRKRAGTDRPCAGSLFIIRLFILRQLFLRPCLIIFFSTRKQA